MTIPMQKRRKRKWQIQCGIHNGIIEAQTIGRAWRKLTKGKTDGFAELARFTECYKGKPWFYISPKALDRTP